MIVEAHVTINESRAAIWDIITNIENASEIISGIQRIDIIEKPSSGLIGLRWRETRLLFGKPATVEKWITDAAGNEFYQTRAEDAGFIFLTTKRISGKNGAMTLTETHESRPQGFFAKLQSIPMKLFFKGIVRRALLQDLQDIKAAVERK